MAIRRRLRRLEELEGELFETLTFPDGREIRYQPNEMLHAFAAYMDGREHWLLPYVLQANTRQGTVGLIRMLEKSKELYGS
jgi:hypothetical protein